MVCSTRHRNSAEVNNEELFTDLVSNNESLTRQGLIRQVVGGAVEKGQFEGSVKAAIFLEENRVNNIKKKVKTFCT